MKTQIILITVILLITFCFQPAMAQNESALTGSGIKLDNSIFQTDVIVLTGQLMDPGALNIMALGWTVHHKAKIKPTKLLLGDFDASKGVKLATKIMANELTPIIGQDYIFFLHVKAQQQPDSYEAFKIIPATEVNIAKVKALIAALPTK